MLFKWVKDRYWLEDAPKGSSTWIETVAFAFLLDEKRQSETTIPNFAWYWQWQGPTKSYPLSTHSSTGGMLTHLVLFWRQLHFHLLQKSLGWLNEMKCLTFTSPNNAGKSWVPVPSAKWYRMSSFIFSRWGLQRWIKFSLPGQQHCETYRVYTNSYME